MTQEAFAKKLGISRARTKVTPLPARPLVSRDTRSTPSDSGRGGAALQRQLAIGCRQPGHMRPLSVE